MKQKKWKIYLQYATRVASHLGFLNPAERRR